MPAAVLWDFDGTMVDSEPIWAEVQLAILADHGVVWGPDRMDQLVGFSAEVTAREMALAIGGSVSPPELLRLMEARVCDRLTAGLPWLPGARELLAEVSAAGVPSAIVTASSRTIMAAALHQLPAEISFVVNGNDVRVTKPDPEGYLKAARQLGVRPQDTIVLEDSVPGTRAALTAGAIVYAVPALATLEPHPRMRVSGNGLQDTTWAELVEVWNGSQS